MELRNRNARLGETVILFGLDFTAIVDKNSEQWFTNHGYIKSNKISFLTYEKEELPPLLLYSGPVNPSPSLTLIQPRNNNMFTTLAIY